MKLLVTTLRRMSPYRYIGCLLLYQVVLLFILEILLTLWTKQPGLPVLPTEILIDSEKLKLHERNASRYPRDVETVIILIENRSICQSADMVSVLLVVYTVQEHAGRRQTIRSTFANRSYYRQHTVRMVFLLGTDSNLRPQEQAAIDAEHRVFGDIVQGDFEDSVENVRLKEYMGRKWISKNCKNVKYVISIEDDVYVDIFNFFANFYNIQNRDAIMCQKLSKYGNGTGNIASHVRRQTDHIWDTCYGNAIVVSGSLIPKLYKASPIMPHLWSEGVFHFGQVLFLINSVKFVSLEDRRYSSMDKEFVLECFRTDDCELIFGKMNMSDMFTVWETRTKGQPDASDVQARN